MSNLLKPQYYSNVNSEAKIIDYNAMISEKIAKLQREMENAARLSVPLTVEAKSGDSWYDAK